MTDLKQAGPILDQFKTDAKTKGVVLDAVHLIVSSPGGLSLHLQGTRVGPADEANVVFKGGDLEEVLVQAVSHVGAMGRRRNIEALRATAAILVEAGETKQAAALTTTAEKMEAKGNV